MVTVPATDRETRLPVLLALALATVSGAASLMHQLVWVRRMVDALGADAATFSCVIAAFFLGLALGAWFGTQCAPKSLWKGIACAEFAVALLAIPALFSSGWAVWWQSLPGGPRVTQLLLPILLVAPPAAAMGIVLPWMIRAIPSRWSTALYAVNTLGGLCGLILAQFWALPAFGLFSASILAMGLNVLVASGAWFSSRRHGSNAVVAEQANRAIPRSADLGLAFASGFLVLASEVLYQHQFAQVLISSHLSSGLVLAMVLIALSVSAFLTPVAARLGRLALPVMLALSALACALQPMVFVLQRGGLIFLPFDRPLAGYMLKALKFGFPACVLPLLVAGLVFPLVLRRTVAEGADAGWLFVFNGVGGWVGAECAERVLGPAFGLWWCLALAAGGYTLCLLWGRGALRWALMAPLALVIIWSWKIDRRLPFVGLAKNETLARVALGREGVVGVVHGDPDDWRIIFNNTYTLGGSRAETNQERQMLLPMLLHGDARKVAALGVATGSSLAGATLDPALESAEGIELSPLVLRFADEFFAPFNRHVFADPRVHFTLGDARMVLGQRPAAYDVIEGDLFLPWRTGEARLFSREHFQKVRAALRPGGLYCQWLPAYQLTQTQFEAILRTFRQVFPEAWLVRGDFYCGRPIVGLVGGRAFSEVDWKKVAAACQRVRLAGACSDPLLRHVEGVAMCAIGPAPVPPAGPTNTLGNAWLEWDAASNVIGFRESWFTGVPLATYLRDAQKAATHFLPEDLQAAQSAGELCVALEVARTAALPQAGRTEALLRARLPEALREDSGADWQHWPMRFRPALP